MKSRAQEVLERQKAILAARPDQLKVPDSTRELWDAIEQDTRDAEKRVFADFVIAYRRENGALEPMGEYRRCYLVEVLDMSKNPEKIDTSGECVDAIKMAFEGK